MTKSIKLTEEKARRLAVSRQHLSGAETPALLDVVRDLGCVQLDPIRAVERTHLLVLWSRLGQFEQAELDRLRWEERALFEFWAHAASLVLTEEYPVHQWEMARKRKQPLRVRGLDGNTAVIDDLAAHIRRRLRDDGLLFSREFESRAGINGELRWSNGRYVNQLLHQLWMRGEVVVAGRQGNQRQWALANDFLPDWMPREAWTDEQVCRFAAQKAVRALGVATAKQIKVHYTRGRYPDLNKVLAKLVAEGVLLEAEISGSNGPLPGPYYLHRDDLPLLESLRAGQWQPRTTLLSPFDNLICDRERTEALFDFYFRIEIYVPEAKREFGYYVLPILHGDRLIGRIDPKMDRKTGTLHVNRVYAEADAPDGVEVGTAVNDAIHNLAEFLGAKRINWGEVPAQWVGLAR